MTKEYLRRQFQNFKTVLLDNIYAKVGDIPTITDLVTQPLSPRTTNVGVYTSTYNSPTITQKSNNIVNVSNATTGWAGAFFSVEINPNVDNILTFDIKNIDTEEARLYYSIYANVNGSNKQIFSQTTDGITNQTIEKILTPEIIQANNITSPLVIGLTNNKIASYDVSVTVSYGNNDVTLGSMLQEVETLKDIKTLADKKVIFLGDSITALTSDRSWVDKFCTLTGAVKIANVAVASAVLADKEGTVLDGNPQYNGADNNVNNTLSNQVQKIINNAYETPDIIVIAIGTNDGISADENRVKATYLDTNNELVPLADLDRTTKEGAFRYCNEKLHNLYPNAVICWCNPIQGASELRPNYRVTEWANALKTLTSYGGVNNIETNRCGIIMANETRGANGECLQDGLHPNSNGAAKMARYNAAAISKLFI